MKFSGNLNRFLINLFNSGTFFVKSVKLSDFLFSLSLMESLGLNLGKAIRLLISLDSTTRSSIPTSSFPLFPNIIKSSISLSFRLMLSMKLCVGLRVKDFIVVKENTAVFPVGSSLSDPVLGVVTVGSSLLSSNLFGRSRCSCCKSGCDADFLDCCCANNSCCSGDNTGSLKRSIMVCLVIGAEVTATVGLVADARTVLLSGTTLRRTFCVLINKSNKEEELTCKFSSVLLSVLYGNTNISALILSARLVSPAFKLFSNSSRA
uniref:Uncharacterized protein n=1 Tax=Glossina austeni TaxID=7395 RepID=A0A1A9VCT1_GLOAU